MNTKNRIVFFFLCSMLLFFFMLQIPPRFEDLDIGEIDVTKTEIDITISCRSDYMGLTSYRYTDKGEELELTIFSASAASLFILPKEMIENKNEKQLQIQIEGEFSDLKRIYLKRHSETLIIWERKI